MMILGTLAQIVDGQHREVDVSWGCATQLLLFFEELFHGSPLASRNRMPWEADGFMLAAMDSIP